MATVPPSMQSAILAVLREARDAGLGPLSRTALFKLVYLLDCSHAQSHSGHTASEARWYFHHYGPYAVDLADAIDELSARGLIQSRAGEYGNKEFSLYWLGEYPQGPSLADVGLGGVVAGRLSALIRKLAKDLPKLLDHVYFKTLPMKGAVPGQSIRFDALAESAEEKSHQHTHVRDNARILRLMQLADRLAQNFEAKKGNGRALAAHRPIYDQVYEDALTAFDREDEGLPVNFDARLV